MKHQFHGTIEADGVFVPYDYPSYRQHMDSLIAQQKKMNGEPRTFVWTLEPKTNKRTLAMNNYQWGVMYATVLPVLQRYSETPITLDMVHEWAKAMFLPINMTVPGVDEGTTERPVVVGGSTKKLTTITWQEYKTRFQVWWAERGVVVPDPDQQDWLQIQSELLGNEKEE